jgi:hypothetical protein
VSKIIREIAKLLWKALRLVLWKWLGPLLKRVGFLAVIVTGLIALVVFIFTRI